MNKEQKKPQEISSATFPRWICYLCEEEIPCEHYPQQKKPQEECSHYISIPINGKTVCYYCAQDVNASHITTSQFASDIDITRKEEDREKLTVLLKLMPDGGALIMQLIHSNFIAKRDLRKLLEGKKKQLSQYDDEKELHDDAWNYNLVLDDIKTAVEKL